MILQGKVFDVEGAAAWEHFTRRSKNNFTGLLHIHIKGGSGRTAVEFDVGSVCGRAVFRTLTGLWRQMNLFEKFCPVKGDK